MILSGQTTVATAGTAVKVSSDNSYRTYMLRALPGNTGVVYVGNDGADDVTVANGLPLDKADPPILFEGKLSELWVDAASGGDKLSWLLVLKGA